MPVGCKMELSSAVLIIQQSMQRFFRLYQQTTFFKVLIFFLEVKNEQIKSKLILFNILQESRGRNTGHSTDFDSETSM